MLLSMLQALIWPILGTVSLLSTYVVSHVEQDKLDKMLSFEITQNLEDIMPAFVNISIMDRVSEILNTKPTVSSTRCERDLYRILQGVRNTQLWAINMLDAFGKPGSDLLQGNTRWPGSYSQCRSAVSKDYIAAHGTSFGGLYCWLHLKSASNGVVSDPVWKYVTFSTSLCFPDSCSEDEVAKAINQSGLLSYFKYVEFSYVQCHTQKIFEEDTKAVVAYLILRGFLFLLTAGTLYDLRHRHFYCCVLHLYVCARRRYSDGGQANVKKKYDSDRSSYSYYKIVQNEEYSRKRGQLTKVGESRNKARNSEKTLENTRIWVTSPQRSCLCAKILKAFSLYTNGSNLFRTTTERDSLPVLNGIRSISVIWVIFGHTHLLTLEHFMVDNPITFGKGLGSFAIQAITKGSFAVDSFLVLSGLLLTYHHFNAYHLKSRNYWLKFYIGRYCRLTPTYAAVMFLVTGHLWSYWGDGPFWPPATSIAAGGTCYTYWWWNLLYINNFLGPDYKCMEQTWYLAINMQFYIISPIFLITLTRSVRLAGILAAITMLTSWSLTGVEAYLIKLPIYFDVERFSFDDYGAYFNNIYIKPYCRISPYLIGMACGWLLFKTKCNVKMNKKWVFLGWMLAAAGNLSVIYGAYKIPTGREIWTLYYMFSRTVWGLGVCWVIFACCNGYGGWVTRILNLSIWNVLSRLTYSAFLCHIAVIYFFMYNMETLDHYQPGFYMVYRCLNNVICSFLGALLINLAFESPAMNIQKIFLRR